MNKRAHVGANGMVGLSVGVLLCLFELVGLGKKLCNGQFENRHCQTSCAGKQ